MSTQILTLINKALSRVGELPISEHDFEEGQQSAHTLCREALHEILEKMHSIKNDPLLQTSFTFNTIENQAEYNLNFNLNYMNGTRLFLIDTLNDIELRYRSMQDAIAHYGVKFDRLDTQIRKPEEYWFHTTNIEGLIQLRLYPTPDKVYEIRGTKFKEYNTIGALDITPFTKKGDMVIQSYIEMEFAKDIEKGNTGSLIEKHNALYHSWLCETQKLTHDKFYYLPVETQSIYD